MRLGVYLNLTKHFFCSPRYFAKKLFLTVRQTFLFVNFSIIIVRTIPSRYSRVSTEKEKKTDGWLLRYNLMSYFVSPRDHYTGTAVEPPSRTIGKYTTTISNFSIVFLQVVRSTSTSTCRYTSISSIYHAV
jgi:hypothetical protein